MGVTRDPETQAAIDAARQDPETWSERSASAGWGHSGIREDDRDAELGGADAVVGTPDGKLHPTNNGCKACDAFAWAVDEGKALVLRGPELDAYLTLRAAAAQAHAAQQSMAVSGQQLRDAIAKLCAVIAPGERP